MSSLSIATVARCCASAVTAITQRKVLRITPSYCRAVYTRGTDEWTIRSTWQRSLLAAPPLIWHRPAETLGLLHIDPVVEDELLDYGIHEPSILRGNRAIS